LTSVALVGRKLFPHAGDITVTYAIGQTLLGAFRVHHSGKPPSLRAIVVTKIGKRRERIVLLERSETRLEAAST
jgi:hypothetical protein